MSIVLAIRAGASASLLVICTHRHRNLRRTGKPRWGFRAEQIPDPHGDEDQAGRWHTGPGDTAASLIAALRTAGEQTRAIVSAAELTDISAPGGRFGDSDPRPRLTLAWILVYVLQEYARHAGHLDIARELIHGTTGE